MSNLSSLLKSLTSKSTKFNTPMPVYILSGKLEKAAIASQLLAMQQQGIQKIILKIDNSAVPTYPSADFFACLWQVFREARKLSMQIFFSDDLINADPGASAALTLASPALRMKYLSLARVLKVKGPHKFSHDFEESGIQYVFALKSKDRVLEFSSAKNLTPMLKNNQLKCELPTGDWRLFIFRECANIKPVGGYALNVLDKNAARAYINAAFDNFKKTMPKDAAPALAGFVVELPSVAPDTSIRGIPWTLEIQKKLNAACGADTMTSVLSLFVDGYSAKNGLIRRTFYSSLLDLLNANFIKPLAEFGKKSRCGMHIYLNGGDHYSTEHMLQFDWSSCAALPAVEGITAAAPFSGDNCISARLFADLKSLNARQSRGTVVLGRNRIGVGLSPKDIKFESDELSIHGIHSAHIDGSYSTLGYHSGMRTPANTFVHSSFYGSYQNFLSYLMRKQFCLEKTPHAESVAVLFPGQTFYTYYNPSHLAGYKLRLQNFTAVINQLVADSIPFNFLTEAMAANLTVTPKGEAIFKHNGKNRGIFKILIVPETLIVSKRLAALFELFAKRGGKIVFFGITPHETFEKGKDPLLARRMEALQSAPGSPVTTINKTDELESLRTVCGAALKRVVDVAVEGLVEKRILARVFSEGSFDYVFMLNKSRTESIRAEIKVNRDGFLYYLDMNSGAISPVSAENQHQTVQSFIYTFSPGEAAWFVRTGAKIKAPLKLEYALDNPSRVYRIIFKDEWELEPLDLNALPLSSWTMKINSNRDINAGLNMAYESYISVEHVPSTCYIALHRLINQYTNGPDSGVYPVEVSFNGVRLKPMQFFGRGENEFQETEIVKKLALGGASLFAADVSQHIKHGINRVTVKTFGSTYHPLLIKYPVYLAGNFALNRGNQGWFVAKKAELFKYGSWTSQGYPFYCGRAIYRQVFEKPGTCKRAILRLSNFDAHVVVRLNGKEAPILSWQPATADITSFMNDDKNKLEIEITNLHNNLLKMVNTPAGLLGEVFLDVY
ncbi:MAG: hypothetical protein A2487_16835 [Candidatus Raymondbacteria bacterium RifOxyC12_full_50_8]|uniref:Glycosyl hydrolases family 2 sugar binding domain-containing protein n=1 Tax=Candidatus Raymondbacteria bacterium RIFOXYD12_FULL_49_13 TaxID=1817890 RepID=A0A1F7F089_UNCRA|nr:MAG: hypothetical protein A2248_21710 [Candidatus Raymondbacteria bacterium RIFOXYA2_FULL_49_16]OGK00055.1 MAG: hypothetical protein A2519_22265 [Candidatus Raymondbacteria bacterium RIFOXYD12_FULL_49_13]OGK01345.1 MAG: hypothetical protein A2487_16835 [Candidatus Raymondbacteria bacterium RifOxyC12_full_50_8]OGK03672.1 MAG: hypothetical protein A2350_12945 [Candidatus Raymondbacteria bacterium RifOxyB12_full_50_8]OGP45044.1 MAG: hypothetical protein A2324_13590 [Candidatus Raymondbacteria b